MSAHVLSSARRLVTVTLFSAAISSACTANAKADSVRRCPSFVVFHGSGFTYRATEVRRTSSISCRRARHLLEAAYGQGPLRHIRVVYQHAPDGQPYGRPTYWLVGGWRCSNGAGGAVCWNVRHRRYNVIRWPWESFRWAVSANVR